MSHVKNLPNVVKTDWPIEALQCMRNVMQAAVDAHNPNKPRPDVLHALTEGNIELKVQVLNDLDRVITNNS